MFNHVSHRFLKLDIVLLAKEQENVSDNDKTIVR